MSTASPYELLDLALALPEDDRLRIASELMASVKPPGLLSADDPGFLEEIQRRSDEIAGGTAKLVDADEAIQQMRAALRRRPSP